MHKFIALLVLAGLACGSRGLAAEPESYPVFFQPWSASIDANAAATIAIAAKQVLAQPEAPVIVVGSADTVGGGTANQDMAETRAQVVADALVQDGVPRPRIAIVSTGSLKAPGAASGTFAQFSRRVLIQVGN
jgi:outer membrane protein OmpA-like peptidoglycan-associated protein